MDYLELEKIKNRLIEVANKSEQEIFAFIKDLLNSVEIDEDVVIDDFTSNNHATDMVDVELDVTIGWKRKITKEKLIEMLNDCDSLNDIDPDDLVDIDENYEVSWALI